MLGSSGLNKGILNFSNRGIILTQLGLILALVLIKHEYAQQEAKNHEKRAEDNRTLFKDIGRAGTECLVCHLGAKGSAEAFLFGALHQHQQKKQG